MKWQVLVRPPARADLRDAYEWYESKRGGLGDEFLLEVADVFQQLEESADRCPVYYRDFRRLMTHRFPYKVFYRLEGESAIVFRVLHAAREHVKALGRID